jgi:hypothetical protein
MDYKLCKCLHYGTAFSRYGYSICVYTIFKFAKYCKILISCTNNDQIPYLCQVYIPDIIYRDVQKVFGHCNISYKTTFFSKHYSKVNSCSILMIFLPTEARTYVVFYDYFKIFFWSTYFKYSWFKHKLKLFVFKCTIIVLCFLM